MYDRSMDASEQVGRRALVIGGSHGIGRATVMRLTRDGWSCAIGYSSNDEAARDTAARAEALGVRPVLVKGDVAGAGGRLVERAVADLGGLDAIVLTAGVETLGRTLETTYEDFHRAMDVQVWGLLEVVRAAAPQLAESHGAVVAVSGITADRYAKYYGPIGPSKGALETMVRYLAAELGPTGVRVNAISPCLIADEDHWKPDEVAPFWEAVRKRTPLRRLSTPDDIAGSIVALLGPDLGFVTGHILVVDGGYTLLS
jgi:NAD(P)-dependent dehydrogenase (short-subunit alcohol dehydrogenase family)